MTFASQSKTEMKDVVGPRSSGIGDSVLPPLITMTEASMNEAPAPLRVEIDEYAPDVDPAGAAECPSLEALSLRQILELSPRPPNSDRDGRRFRQSASVVDFSGSSIVDRNVQVDATDGNPRTGPQT